MSSADGTSLRTGFTIIEVLVAMAMAGLLCMTYLGALRHSAGFANDASRVIANVALAQEYLATRPIGGQQSPVSQWTPWENDENREWRLETRSLSPYTLYILGTRVDGVSMNWTWVAP